MLPPSVINIIISISISTSTSISISISINISIAFSLWAFSALLLRLLEHGGHSSTRAGVLCSWTI